MEPFYIFSVLAAIWLIFKGIAVPLCDIRRLLEEIREYLRRNEEK